MLKIDGDVRWNGVETRGEVEGGEVGTRGSGEC